MAVDPAAVPVELALPLMVGEPSIVSPRRWTWPWFKVMSSPLEPRRPPTCLAVEKLVPESEFDDQLAALKERPADQLTYIMGLAKRQVHSGGR